MFSNRVALVAAAGTFLLAGCGRARARAGAAPAGTDDPSPAALGNSPKELAAILTPAMIDEPAKPKPCPAGMLLVDGMYCPKVEQHCLHYMDPPGRYHYFRCAEYQRPARCLSKHRVHKRFCIDKYEYEKPGDTLPENHESWTDANRICKSLGKRVCLESEYNFACEGEQMRPYPYGWTRDSTACNADHFDVLNSHGQLKDMRAARGEYPRCVSPFGVHDLAGNLEEFVTIDGTHPALPAMKGAYWQPSRNFCRAAQTAHDRYYSGTETGFRCCADPKF